MTVLGPDLLLDPLTHDLTFVDGDMVMSADVAQAVKINLLFIQDDWFLNLAAGVPYFEKIFVKAPNLDHVAAIFRRTIVETPGVGALTKFVFDFDGDTRIFTLEWAADTDEGEIGDVEMFTI